MILRRLTTRTAVAGVSVALAAVTLVGLGTSAADAATKSASYDCKASGVTTIPLTVTAAADLSAYPTLPSGYAVTGGLVQVDLSFTVPEASVADLKADEVTSAGASSSNLAFPFGDGAVPIAAFDIAPVMLPDEGPLVLSAKVPNAAFKLPSAGKSAVKMPKQFTVKNLVPGKSLVCTATSQPVITSYTIGKQTASLVVTPPKSVKKNKAFALVVKVTGAVKAVTGKVTAKAGKKTLGTGVIKKGKAVIKVKKGIKKDTTITVFYGGDKDTTGSKSFAFTVPLK